MIILLSVAVAWCLDITASFTWKNQTKKKNKLILTDSQDFII